MTKVAEPSLPLFSKGEGDVPSQSFVDMAPSVSASPSVAGGTSAAASVAAAPQAAAPAPAPAARPARRRSRPRKHPLPEAEAAATAASTPAPAAASHAKQASQKTGGQALDASLDHETLIKEIEAGTLSLSAMPKRRRGRPRKADVEAREAAIAAALEAQRQSMAAHEESRATSVPAAASAPAAPAAAPAPASVPAVPAAVASASAAESASVPAFSSSLSQNDASSEQQTSLVARESQALTRFDRKIPRAERAEHTERLERAEHTERAQRTPVQEVHVSFSHDAQKGESQLLTTRARRRHNSAQKAPAAPSREQTNTHKQQEVASQQRFVKQPRNQRRRKQDLAQNAEPTLSLEDLSSMKVAELRLKAAELGVESAHVRKKELVEAIYKAAAASEGFSTVSGVLDIQQEGYAFIRTGNYMGGDDDAFVHQQLIRQYHLRPGDWIEGRVAPGRSGNKFPPLHKITSINGRLPEELKNRPRFRDLTPIFPDERLVQENGQQSITGRAIDLVAPIGKGQRGLIVSPPKAGKTTILKKICQSITANNPEVHLFCLLVDERPEEVTDMQRSIKGVVVASTFDMPAENHTAVSELVIEHAKRLVELGEDVVVVLDSITRLARAYNLAQPASGRILSGGVDSAALYPPKKFLGAARNIEGGGSLTILASALIDTGSKMDEVIFEEFKGTGNMELKLDRDLADRRIFPAIDPVASGTRNEDLLIDKELQPFIWGLRRVLANMNNTERAASALVKGLKETTDNRDFLIRSARKAQAIDYVDSPSKL